MTYRLCLALASAIMTLVTSATAQTLPESHFPNGIPQDHPRLWWNAERLAQARQWYAAHPFEPSSRTDVDHYSSNPLDNAFKYLLTGETRYCDVAKTWALRALDEIPVTGTTGCNECRWYAGAIIVVYDWCHAALGEPDRATITSTMNAMNSHWNEDHWGAPEPRFAESNFFWGYLRNSLTWGIASYGENPAAGGFIDHAMDARWDGVFVPHVESCNPHGVFEEGSDYGHYMVDYPLVPVITGGLLGRDMLRETDYFKGAVFNVIYNTVPAPTYRDPSSSTPRLSQFPYGDAQDFVRDEGDYWETGTAQRVGVARFMKTMAAEFNGRELAAYARQWISTTEQGVPALYVLRAIAAVDPGTEQSAFSSLPLDYYAGGPCIGQAYSRTGWGASDTVVHLQPVAPPMVGHEHGDTGSWQIWRKRRWLALEAPGRALSGFEVPAYGGTGGTTDVMWATAHNTLMFAGQGLASTGAGVAVLNRLESEPEYFYAAADLTPAYHSDEGDQRYGNPSVGHAEREFIFIRPLETLVIFDRMQSAGSDTRKGFLVHAQGPFVSSGANSHTATNVDQLLRVTTVAPASPTFRAIDERSAAISFPYRLEVETSGAGVQHFLHVAQVRDLSGQDLSIDAQEDAAGYAVTLSHPSLGCAELRLEKGVTSSGGAVGFAATCGAVTMRPLAADVEGIEITDDGPVWSGTADPGEIALSIGNASVVEGDGGTKTITFDVHADP